MNKRCIITTAFGDRRKNITRLIKNIRSFVDYPIIIYTSEDSMVGFGFDARIPDYRKDNNVEIKLVERLWPNHPRSGQRNGDYYQMQGCLESKYNSILYLDDDMHIINKDFAQGFDLAEKFSICLPLNPRSFVGVDAAIGADVPVDKRNVDLPLATAYNCGTMFIDKKYNYEAREFLGYCSHVLNTRPIRGPMAVWETVDELDIVPYLLPPQWCVCQENIGCQSPIILHCGHEKVREYYGIA